MMGFMNKLRGRVSNKHTKENKTNETLAQPRVEESQKERGEEGLVVGAPQLCSAPSLQEVIRLLLSI